jgi:hypothetical protein
VNVIVGLCAICRNARIIENRRGSTFWLCALSRTDARFPRYPSLPVLECSGYVDGTPRRNEGLPGQPSDERGA